MTTATALKRATTQPHRFATSNGPPEPSRPFQATTSDGVKVRVSYVPSKYSNSSAHGALTLALRAMNEFSADFGTYPYAELDVVLSPLSYHGMEYPTFVFTDPRAVSIYHEIAHQWWYGIVGNNQFSSPWLDESFATWAQKLPGTADQCDEPQHGRAAPPGSRARWRTGAATPSQYWVLYETGRVRAGRDAPATSARLASSAVLHSYAADHRYGIATTADFKAGDERRPQVRRRAGTWRRLLEDLAYLRLTPALRRPRGGSSGSRRRRARWRCRRARRCPAGPSASRCRALDEHLAQPVDAVGHRHQARRSEPGCRAAR